ncbi:MAG: TraB domain-containing protein [Candidatus Thorarchaeota archaeon]|nr:TraB domain-containing protein [Candidatus Thorarchaeota archaeon]
MLGKQLDRIVLVAVIHTDLESVEEARRVVREIKPSVVAVELDHDRYEYLKNPDAQNELTTMPLTGDTAQNLMQQLATMEQALGGITGSNVGDEMMAAIEEGRAIDARIALVDRPMKTTIQAMMTVPLDELYGLIDMLPNVTKDIEEGGAIDLMDMLKQDGAVDDIVEQFRTEFPGLARVLIEERDQYVAKALHFILNDVQGKIVAVLGAGHIQGVKAALEDLLSED